MERMEERFEKKRSKSNNATVVVGLIFLVIGGFLFADRFDLIAFNWNKYIFTWPSLLMAIGLISLAKNESKATGIVLIAIGGVFLSARIFGFYYPIRYLIWPTVFVGIGLILIFQKGGHSHKSRFHQFNKGVTDMDVIDDVAIFGGSDQKITSQNFKGGKITNIFGGGNYDMMGAELAPGRNVLDMFCFFGGSKIIVPAGWSVKIEIISIFGGYSDKRRIAPRSGGEVDRELVIKGVVIFGGGEIKGY